VRRIPECHPDQPHYAKGLCRACRERQRRRENPAPRSKFYPIPHGTSKGYQRHRYRGEDACEQCLIAWRDEHRRRYRPHLRTDAPTIAESIIDVLITEDRWLTTAIVVALVGDLHPDWSPASIRRRTLDLKDVVDYRLIDGQTQWRADWDAWEAIV